MVVTSQVRRGDADGRNAIARRLITGSVKRSYEPVVDLDWDREPEPDRYFLPPRALTLAGTELWAGLSEEQRIEVSRQELANILSVGIWFENLLNRTLMARLMTADAASATTHYALTEMGDECRHMVMFGRAIEWAGARPFRMRLAERGAMTVLPYALRGSLLWVAALVGEEIFDALQREMLDDPQLQPLVARLMQIHVAEEARHIGFARDGIMRRKPTRSRWETFVAANGHAVAGVLFRRLFTNPAMYRRAGLDGRHAARVARSNPHFREVQVRGFASLAAFFSDAGLMSRLSRYGWQRGGFLP
ncbi:diiron oxygenase [Gordonia sp. HNM0687]|uniref:Diiron oxygenase n=1 Tax=Gordonia mangrovi TaxID=2665643 RepID=A0A6L7GSK9_9ACTN|nr:diiron oxygenase [Gordonia mangrovi]MXP21518.1 diiron oxygenase [Gordonia mangrovi]UVF80262.1 diiron oxygenase [Gordonia mangrovi]